MAHVAIPPASSVPEAPPSGWRFDPLRRRLSRAGGEISLTPRETEILLLLVGHHGRVVSRVALEREVWRQTRRATPLDNVIDVQMMRLRQKLRLTGIRIETRRGDGYRLRQGLTLSLRVAA